MRLLKVDTLQLHEFFEGQIPPYAILSHRWEDGEVSLQQLLLGEGKDGAGFSKILNCCAQAVKDGWGYVVGSILHTFVSTTLILAVDRYLLYR
jgi:hypothetical protein